MIGEGMDPPENTRIRYGMVGGGEGAFIGEVHRRAIALDGMARLAAGSFSRSPEKTLRSGLALGLPPERIYSTYQDMARQESRREDGIDFVAVVTPNKSHFAIARAFLEEGIHVVCDKPLTTDSSQARELSTLAQKKGLLFGVTYTYSGYPMVKHARDMIAQGALGTLRFVHAEYVQEWLADPVEKEGQKQAAWRLDPELAGISSCVGDIGTHIENTVAVMTGLRIRRLSSRLDRMVPGRVLDDNASIMVEYQGGAGGLYWSSQIAIGHDNGLVVRVYGSQGSLIWRQESPNYLDISGKNQPFQRLSRGRDALSPRAAALSRIPAGHPEGYLEAFANIYKTYIGALVKKKAGQPLDKNDLDFPQGEEGVSGVRFVEKCVESSQKGSQWVDFL